MRCRLRFGDGRRAVNSEEAARFLTRVETAGLLPQERVLERSVERAALWAQVLGPVSLADAQDALVVLAKREARFNLRPGDVLAVVNAARAREESRERWRKGQALKSKHYARLVEDPEYRARYEAAVQAAKDAVKL